MNDFPTPFYGIFILNIIKVTKLKPLHMFSLFKLFFKGLGQFFWKMQVVVVGYPPLFCSHLQAAFFIGVYVFICDTPFQKFSISISAPEVFYSRVKEGSAVPCCQHGV